MAEHQVTHLRLTLSLDPQEPTVVVGHLWEARAREEETFRLIGTAAYFGIGIGDWLDEFRTTFCDVADRLPRELPFV